MGWSGGGVVVMEDAVEEKGCGCGREEEQVREIACITCYLKHRALAT